MTAPQTLPAEGVHTIAVNLELAGKPVTLKLRVDLAQMSHRMIVTPVSEGRLYEEALSFLLLRILRPGDRFLDVGGHIGFFSLLASHLVGDDGRVMVLEPNADNFAWLTDLMALNERGNVTAVNKVASETDGTIEFFRNADNDGGHALWDPGLHDFNKQSRENPEKDSYPSTRLDTLTGSEGFDTCRAVKIDTEGAELTVLKGGGEFFVPDRVPFVVCEINGFGLQQMGASQEMLRAHMKDRGYDTFAFGQKDSLPALVPDSTVLTSPYVFNILFSTMDAVAEAWPVAPVLEA
ncbi:MAG: FkbM family methyltransferase [Rhodospirillales bacterium]